MYFFYNNKINKVMEVYSLPCLKKKKFSWTKELRTLDKKLNGKKTSEIKSFIGKEMSSNPQSQKSNYLQGE